MCIYFMLYLIILTRLYDCFVLILLKCKKKKNEVLFIIFTLHYYSSPTKYIYIF
ncbi:expressed protein [Phakopsora pachyrhizi]|uniref:Expressed protein n=1 Tax=Phakopsora pachyrhizi TaxID=170000 RepID=A0AAV0AWS2_PHAPC|nr:expressed protein [Phakopsora pachyrhizi]